MQDAVLLDLRVVVRAGPDEPHAADCEASQVADLLAQAGVDHASSLWFQLLELATQQACDWSERSTASGAALSARAAAVLGLRSLAADLLSSAGEQDDVARAAAEACLNVCAEIEGAAMRPPPRRRRWGEGALPASPQRPDLLQRSAGCC